MDFKKENGVREDDPQHAEFEVEDKIDKESDYYQRNELPVDRGWAWAICLGGFVVSFNFGLARQVLAVLFLEVIDLYETSLTTGSLIFLFYTVCAGLLSSFSSNFIVPKVGEKTVVCVSGLLTAIGSIGYFFAPNIEVFLLCAAAKGLCTGAAFVPSISLIRHYFHMRRSIAQMMARSGDSIATIAMPPLVRLLRNSFGVRGAFLVVAAIELHTVLAGLLLRPVQSYRFKPDLPPLENKNKWSKKKKIVENGKQDDTDMELPERKESLLKIPDEQALRPRTTSVTSVGAPDELDVALDYKQDNKEDEDIDIEQGTSRCGNCSFFGLWGFRMAMVFAVFGAADMYMRNYIPTISVSQGASLDQAAILLTLVGVVDLFSRLGLGLFADTHLLTPSQIILIAEIVLGVTSQVIRYFDTVPKLVIMNVLLGLFIGTRYSMLPLVCIEVVGVEKMPQAFGIITTIGTMAASTFNPILGAVAESAGGSFVPVMHIVGVFFFIGASLLLILQLCKKIDRRRANKPI